MKPVFSNLLLSLLIVLSVNGVVEARVLNGFDISGAAIDQDLILPGGPQRDGIPAIDTPVFERAEDNSWLAADAPVIGVELNGMARAYPLAILNWHEIVNDRFGDQGVVVTYCPLCGSGVVYRSEAKQQPLTFGVSGLLFNSDVLLYDRQTESLWSQLHHRAVSGPMQGETLQQIPAVQTRWASWLERYPDTLVLSRNTGSLRNYDRNPYVGYDDSAQLFFSVQFRSQAFHPKARVLGLELNGEAKAYPFSELAKLNVKGGLDDTLAGQNIRIEYDATVQEARVYSVSGEELPAINLFWFAWYTFHPETRVFRVD